jgi:hypothetical protein
MRARTYITRAAFRRYQQIITGGCKRTAKLANHRRVLLLNANQARARAEASFKKEERAREGAKAMMEYEAEARATREKTARLRALRLAKKG